MFRFFGKLLATPLRLVGYGMNLFRAEPSLWLWRTTWQLSNNPDDASNYIGVAARRKGIEFARQQATRVIEKCRDSKIALTMGWLEIQSGGGADHAAEWVNLARKEALEREQLLLQLDLYLARDNEEKAERVVEQILSRRDVPMELTRSALWSRGWKMAEQERFEQVEQIADKILAVEEHYEGRILKWMSLAARGEDVLASQQLELARRTMPSQMFEMVVGQGWLMLGREDKAADMFRAGGYQQ